MPRKDSGEGRSLAVRSSPEAQPEVGSSSPVFYALWKGPAITWRPCWNGSSPGLLCGDPGAPPTPSLFALGVVWLLLFCRNGPVVRAEGVLQPQCLQRPPLALRLLQAMKT